MDVDKIHIGQLIKKVVRDNNMKDVDLAKKIGKSRQNIYDLYKRNDVEVKLLLTICHALNYDFFHCLYPLRGGELPETEVSIQLKVKSDNLDDLFKWVSENGNISISKKQ
ncbi:MAG: helix-turn-helix transcriptional regulator [Tannerellaceae bacterium]|jgi:DNA-binding Xre family transcriptional regulator|nr:helix-turn-helix transcriptional regulator [Tannerellaceae bacterium]